MIPEDLDAIESEWAICDCWRPEHEHGRRSIIAALREAWAEAARLAADLLVQQRATDEAEAALDRVRALCSQNGYTTWDREKHLGEPPWRHDDPAVQAWEKAHGHDVRLKCYGEFGCRLLIDPEDIRAAIEGES